MSHLKLLLLGAPQVESDNTPCEFDTRKALALLAYLAVTNQTHSRDALATLFWPEQDQTQARTALRYALWALQKGLGKRWFQVEREHIGLTLSNDFYLDVKHFQAQLVACRTHGHAADEVCPACLPLLNAAVALYRGDFLAGFTLRDSPGFDDWQFFQAESLRQDVAAALERLVHGHSAQGEYAQAIPSARRWLALDPLHEPAQRQLMQVYAQAGQQAAALRQYQECVRILDEEMGAPPEAETTALYEQIRSKQMGTRPAKPAPAAITPPQPAPPVPASPTPPVQELQPSTAPAAEDELRMVTVLCAALTEPLPSAKAYPSEQSAQRMKRIFQVAEAILLRYEGRVERFLGEGVVALFGTQQLHEDDPERAVRAALELRQAAQTAGLQMSAGITTGHVYLSSYGSSMATIGPVVNLALRLQSKADADQLLVSEATYRQTRGVAVYTPLPLALQSNAAPLRVYQIERLQPHPQKVRGIAGLHAPLVGRNKELSALQNALAAVQSGEGQLITLIGDAGVGKSRLVNELRQGDKENSSPLSAVSTPAPEGSPPLPPSLSPCLWLEGRCLEMTMSASYWPFLDILRTYLDWQAEGAEASRAGRIVAALDALVGSGNLTAEQREEMGPLLGNLLAVRFGNDWDERLKFAGPEQLRHQTLVTLRDFFVGLSRQGPLVFVLEDLHWADNLSLDLITLLMETLAEQPFLLLCVYRPERQHRAWQLATLAAAKCPERFTEVRLRELTPKQSQQLVEALLTIENLAPKVKATILQKTQGNPLFVEEVIRSLIDAGIVYRQAEVWRAKEEIENVLVPETVQSVILSRVDRLDEALKGVLQRAAVIGRVFGRRLLVQLAPPDIDLDDALQALTNHALIYQERVVPEEEYSFKHVLMQEAIYQTTLRERRQQFHRQVAEAIEQLYADNLTERYEQLAYHYDRSDVVEKAIEYLLKAGEKARRAYLNDEAINYFQRTLERLEAQIQVFGEPDKAWRLDALRGLGQIYHGIGKMAEAEIYFQQAIVLGRELGLATRELVRLFHWLCDSLWWQDRYDEQLQVAQEGLALLGDDQHTVEAALMNDNVAMAHHTKGDVDRYWEYARRNITFITRLGYTEELRSVYYHIFIAYASSHNIAEGMQWAQIFEQKAQQSHDWRGLATVYRAIAESLREIGDVAHVPTHYQQSLELFTKIGDVKHASDPLVGLAGHFLECGELQQAEDHVQRALALQHNVGNVASKVWPYHVLGVVSLCQGFPLKAAAAFHQARQALQTLRSPQEVSASIGLARTALVLANRDEARQLFQQALSLTNPTTYSFWQQWFMYALSGLEEISDNATFSTFCRDLQQETPAFQAGAPVLTWTGQRVANPFVQWYLERTQPQVHLAVANAEPPKNELQALSSLLQTGEWTWHDQFADCSFTFHNGLEIQAANRRDLLYENLSAPRLLRPASGDFVLQTVCWPVSDEKPTQGGILLWKDQANFLRLERGTFGQHEITFLGCLDNNDVFIGRGRLPAERVFLRLERVGERINALCSADGEQWFTVGHVDFPVADPVQVGMHAIGMIDRLIYPGAYPDGTAIRFEAFAVYRA